MIYTDATIFKEIEKGNIVVEPFTKENVGTNSIDLTLSPVIKQYVSGLNYAIQQERDNMYIQCKTGQIMHASKVEGFYLDCKKENKTFDVEIKEGGFVLLPGRLYIASTNEYTETLNSVPVLEGKSSLARLGLFVHVTAGFGDVGFKGTWTLELVATVPLKIYPNMKICQISYHSISEPPLITYDKKESAKYSGQRGPTSSKMNENFIENKATESSDIFEEVTDDNGRKRITHFDKQTGKTTLI